MKRARFLSLVTLAASLVFAASCSDPVIPKSDVQPPPPQADLLGGVVGGVTGLVQNLGLLECTPLPFAETTQTVGTAGGLIRVGPHSLLIPPGALSAPVTITATAPSGNVNFIHFEPEGLVFERSAALTMSYANCSLLGKLLPKRINGRFECSAHRYPSKLRRVPF